MLTPLGGRQSPWSQYSAGKSSPVDRPPVPRRVSTVDGKTVEWDDMVKGFEISKGKFVIVDDEDFEAVAPEMSRVLEMSDFVPAESIDPRYFYSPYYLIPREGGDKAYALLCEALTETGKVGIGTFALRQKQHLAAVKPMGNAVVGERDRTRRMPRSR